MKFFGIYAVQHRVPGVFGPHTHERYEFVYCVEGNGRVERGGWGRAKGKHCCSA